MIFLVIFMAVSSTAVKGERKLDKLDNELIVIETNRGKMVIGLFPDAAPKHVARFKKLTKEGFFNGIRFHRIIPNFMIQAGDPLSKDLSRKARWGTGGYHETLPAEFNTLKFNKGRVGAARTNDPNSASSQFFICVADSPFLNGKYTVFGEILQGQDIADEISKLPRDSRDVPKKDVIIEKMYLVPNTLKPSK
ncbi:MAG: peptidylprolyl isomerase [Candidatus Eremiobacteraeota bacterium]|nr:peptidylprolyl isomerase [Candidatus Eremiobacteraeota bacterium]